MFLEQRLSNPKQAHSFAGLLWISNVRYGGSPPSPPPAPPPPDYAAANRAGVIADVETLPSRRAIDIAAQTGGTALAFGVEERTRTVGGKTETYYVQRFNDKGERYNTPKEITKAEAVIDFKGKSNQDVAKAIADFQRKENDTNAQALLDLQKKYGNQFVDNAKAQLERLDPTGTAARNLLGRLVQSQDYEKITSSPTFKSLGASPTLENIGDGPNLKDVNAGPSFGKLSSGNKFQRIGATPDFAFQSYGPTFALGSEAEGGGGAAVGRMELERQLGEALFNQGKLSVEEERRLNNAVRGGQVARGNTFGNAPLAQEILARFGAETDRARQAQSDVAGWLSSGQSTYDVSKAIRQEANQLAQQGYINYSTALGVNNSIIQKDFENEIAAIGQRNNVSQAELDNLNEAVKGNNQALQQAYQNYVTSIGQNNAVSLQEYQNQINAVAQRNQNKLTAYQNNNAAIQYQNQMAQLGYQNTLNNISQRNQASQQKLANLQSFAGLQPIVAQGGGLSNLGAGAAPVINTPVPQGIGLNPQAGQVGTNFALGVFDNQTRQYNAQLNYLSSTYATQQQYNSPLSWISGIGGVLF